MSQEMRNRSGEGQGNPVRASEGSDRKRYEGFEGMNYEQIRQPYDPKRLNNNRRDLNKDDDRKQQQEI